MVLTNKYKAKKTETDGETFDSKKEAQRWQELKQMERLGIISYLQRQVPFELIPKQTLNGKVIERAVKYIADFVYIDGDETVVEDVKGYRENGAYRIFVIKRKLMLERFGIRVREV